MPETKKEAESALTQEDPTPLPGMGNAGKKIGDCWSKILKITISGISGDSSGKNSKFASKSQKFINIHIKFSQNHDFVLGRPEELNELLGHKKRAKDSRENAADKDHKFWGSQPVPQLGDDYITDEAECGPIDDEQDVEKNM